LFLADAGSTVTIVIRGPDLEASMSRYLVDRIEADARIVVRRNTRIVAVAGDDFLTGIRISGSGGEEMLVTTALFSFIGADPASQWLSGCAALDGRGFVLTDRSLGREHLKGVWEALGRAPLPFETSYPGLFAVGDIRSGSTKRVATAVGEGSAAVRSVHEYLAFNRPV
jgi:thioredoxin reductase (NADPH)